MRTMSRNVLFQLAATVLVLLAFIVSSVHAVGPFGGDVAGSLERKAVKLFEGRHKFPVAMKRDRGNIEVRVRSDGDHVVTISEAKEVLDLHPNQFKKFLQKFKDEFPKVNPMVQTVKPLEKDYLNGNREGVKSILKFPFPLTNRLMIHWKYLKLDRGDNEHMLLLSEQGNEKLLNKYLSKNEKEKYVLARTFLCAYWIKPIYNGKKEVVGSKVQYLFSGDTGGKLPKKVQNLIGPQAACDSVQGLIKHVKKQNGKKVA